MELGVKENESLKFSPTIKKGRGDTCGALLDQLQRSHLIILRLSGTSNTSQDKKGIGQAWSWGKRSVIGGAGKLRVLYPEQPRRFI